MLDYEKKKTKKRTEKKEKRHNQWDPFCFSGNPLLPPTHIHTHWNTHGQRNRMTELVCDCVCVPLCLTPSPSLCVWDWLYLRQGPFCFKPENGSETEAGPVIGLLRPCLAWEKPSLARQCQANSCFQPQRGRTRWSEFRLAWKTSTPPPSKHTPPHSALNTLHTNYLTRKLGEKIYTLTE